MKQSGSACPYIDIVLAPALWFACLSLLYGIVALNCAGLIERADLYSSLAIVATTLVLAWMALRPRVGSDSFARRLSGTLAGLSILATLWISLPLATQTTCAAS